MAGVRACPRGPSHRSVHTGQRGLRTQSQWIFQGRTSPGGQGDESKDWSTLTASKELLSLRHRDVELPWKPDRAENGKTCGPSGGWVLARPVGTAVMGLQGHYQWHPGPTDWSEYAWRATGPSTCASGRAAYDVRRRPGFGMKGKHTWGGVHVTHRSEKP